MGKITVDVWDIGAGVALAAVLVGLGVWYWPAAIIAAGVAYLWVYFHREKSLAAQSASRR